MNEIFRETNLLLFTNSTQIRPLILSISDVNQNFLSTIHYN